jgi:hypothetical protein
MPFDFPGTPSVGDTFVDPATGASYRWNGYAWVGGGAVASNPIVSPTPPSSPADNSLWWESDSGMLFLRYNDGNSSQWVQINALPNGAGYMPLKGVTDGSDALAGTIGEVISSIVPPSGVALTTGLASNITTIPLTAGDWDVSGEVWFTVGTGVATVLVAGISATSATFGSQTLNGSRAQLATNITATTTQIMSLRPARVNLAAPATYYLLGRMDFPSGAPTAYGNIIARRVR